MSNDEVKITEGCPVEKCPSILQQASILHLVVRSPQEQLVNWTEPGVLYETSIRVFSSLILCICNFRKICHFNLINLINLDTYRCMILDGLYVGLNGISGGGLKGTK